MAAQPTPWSELSRDELKARLGGFVNLAGEITDASPSADVPYPIVVSNVWPHPEPTAMRVTCDCCKQDCAVSPDGMTRHLDNPARVFICSPCFNGVSTLAVALGYR